MNIEDEGSRLEYNQRKCGNQTNVWSHHVPCFSPCDDRWVPDGEFFPEIKPRSRNSAPWGQRLARAVRTWNPGWVNLRCDDYVNSNFPLRISDDTVSFEGFIDIYHWSDNWLTNHVTSWFASCNMHQKRTRVTLVYVLNFPQVSGDLRTGIRYLQDIWKNIFVNLL